MWCQKSVPAVFTLKLYYVSEQSPQSAHDDKLWFQGRKITKSTTSASPGMTGYKLKLMSYHFLWLDSDLKEMVCPIAPWNKMGKKIVYLPWGSIDEHMCAIIVAAQWQLLDWVIILLWTVGTDTDHWTDSDRLVREWLKCFRLFQIISHELRQDMTSECQRDTLEEQYGKKHKPSTF